MQARTSGARFGTGSHAPLETSPRRRALPGHPLPFPFGRPRVHLEWLRCPKYQVTSAMAVGSVLRRRRSAPHGARPMLVDTCLPSPAIPCPPHSRFEPLSSHAWSKLCNPPAKRSRCAANRWAVLTHSLLFRPERGRAWRRSWMTSKLRTSPWPPTRVLSLVTRLARRTHLEPGSIASLHSGCHNSSAGVAVTGRGAEGNRDLCLCKAVNGVSTPAYISSSLAEVEQAAGYCCKDTSPLLPPQLPSAGVGPCCSATWLLRDSSI